MPRENSFSDSEGRSLTPDLEDEIAVSPISQTSAHAHVSSPPAHLGHAHENKSHKSHISHKTLKSHLSHISHRLHNGENGRPSIELETTSPRSVRSQRNAPDSAPRTTFQTPTERFRASVRKVMAMRRTSSMMVNRGIGAEPGIDPRRASAFLNYGHIRQQCMIEVVDYSAVRSSFGKMTNREFVDYMGNTQASARDAWVKVRWINIGGISWDVISALAMKYGKSPPSCVLSSHHTREHHPLTCQPHLSRYASPRPRGRATSTRAHSLKS